VIVDGWFDWAERVPYPSWKLDPGVNPGAGVIAHSAEGYERYLREYAQDQTRRASWCLSNLYSGHLLQHYPITAKCWASGSRYPNGNLVAIESEGIMGQRLNAAQVLTVVRVIREISELRGWKPERGVTLWEHREATRWGSDATACPSGRYPWDEIVAAWQPADGPAEGEELSVGVNVGGRETRDGGYVSACVGLDLGLYSEVYVPGSGWKDLGRISPEVQLAGDFDMSRRTNGQVDVWAKLVGGARGHWVFDGGWSFENRGGVVV
jgi:N-acetylmuramoyl-L-alanine amidase